MSTKSAEGDSSTDTPFTIDEIQNNIDIQASPAGELIDSLSGWAELRAGISNNRDWEDIDGVGPSTAESLNSTDAETLPTGGPVGPSEPPEPDVDDGCGEEANSEDSDEDETTEDASESEDEADEEEPEGAAGEDSEDNSEKTVEEAAENQSNDDELDETDEEPEQADDSESLYDLRETPTKFEASIELSRLSAIFDSVNRLVDEAKFRIGEDRIAIRAVDPANVGMVDLDMSTRAFQSYQADPGVIGINLNRMVDVLSVGNSDDTVHLSLNAATRKLTVTVDGLEYTLALIDPDSIRQEPDIPDLKLDTEIKMEAGVLDRAVTASDMVSDHVGFDYSPDGARVYAEGDTDDVDLDLTNVDGVESIKTHNEGSSLFSLDYLKSINKMVPKGETARIEVGDEFPIKIYFGVADSHAEVETLLAPRIKAD